MKRWVNMWCSGWLNARSIHVKGSEIVLCAWILCTNQCVCDLQIIYVSWKVGILAARIAIFFLKGGSYLLIRPTFPWFINVYSECRRPRSQSKTSNILAPNLIFNKNMKWHEMIRLKDLTVHERRGSAYRPILTICEIKLLLRLYRQARYIQYLIQKL